MHFTKIFCCYVLLPYFASFVSPPQEAITCNAGAPRAFIKQLTHEGEPKKGDKPIENLSNRYFDQKLDHYHFTDPTRWQQKYMVYDKHYHGNGIIFIMLGEDTDIVSKQMQTGSWMDYAKETQALCVGIELRSYSTDFPKGETKNEYLKYYNTEQALADVAWFIYNFKDQNTGHELPEKLKWVAYGTGQEGALATWLRMKYPHLIHATFALNAPLLAKEEFDEFFKLIYSDMLDLEQIRRKISEAYDNIKMRLKEKNWTNKKNKELGTLFKFCNVALLDDSEHRDKNLEFMYMTFAEALSTLMRYGKDYLKVIKNKIDGIMLDDKGNYKKLKMTERFILLVNMVARKYENECLHVDYAKAVSEYQSFKHQSDFPLPEIFGNRATLFQFCTEFGQFETFQDLFGTKVDLNYYIEFCHKVFGELSTKEVLERGVRKTNIFYGGLNIKVSRVVFVYGENDPYRKLGVYNDFPQNSVSYVLKEARHCDELKYLTASPNFSFVTREIYYVLSSWLALSGDIEYQENTEIIPIKGN